MIIFLKLQLFYKYLKFQKKNFPSFVIYQHILAYTFSSFSFNRVFSFIHSFIQFSLRFGTEQTEIFTRPFLLNNFENFSIKMN